jgi:glyoxylase-like metal-dependent hydrolase (beta-lactamase superfamily II)
MLSLHVKTFTCNPFQENTYVVYNNEKQAFIVDPGMYFPEEFDRLFEFIDIHQLQPVALLNTHCHIDHVLGIPAVLERFSIPYLFHEKERIVFDHIADTARRFGLHPLSVPEPSGYIREGEQVMLGKDAFTVLFTPGHSPGSICFYHEGEGILLDGDVLFQQSIGRTDLPGGDYNTLIHSITTQLFSLPDAVTVYSGHGPATSIGFEKTNNPFLRG